MTDKYTKRCNRIVSRLSFWHLVKSKLADFDGLMRHRESLTPEDVKTLGEIHIELYKSYSLAKGMVEHHKSELSKLRRE